MRMGLQKINNDVVQYPVRFVNEDIPISQHTEDGVPSDNNNQNSCKIMSM